MFNDYIQDGIDQVAADFAVFAQYAAVKIQPAIIAEIIFENLVSLIKLINFMQELGFIAVAQSLIGDQDPQHAIYTVINNNYCW